MRKIKDLIKWWKSLPSGIDEEDLKDLVIGLLAGVFFSLPILLFWLVTTRF